MENATTDPTRPEHEAAREARRPLQHLLATGNDPGLDMVGGDAGARFEPAVGASDPGKLLQVREALDIELLRLLLQHSYQGGYLRHEFDRDRRQRQQDDERGEQGQKPRGTRAAVQAPPQAQVHGYRRKARNIAQVSALKKGVKILNKA